jgi:hypothetical protein
VPGGSTLKCRVGDRISSKTTDTGDPILCKITQFESLGHQVVPYGSELAGTFEDYKDPGHFVGKGWMVMHFDRIIIYPNTIIPIDAKLIEVSGKFTVDNQGRILGKGHTTKDIVSWMIPILWPIDLINLPRRGPRPVLKAEAQLTVKMLSDSQYPGFAPEQTIPGPVGDPVLRQRPASYQVPTYGYPQPNMQYAGYPTTAPPCDCDVVNVGGTFHAIPRRK